MSISNFNEITFLIGELVYIMGTIKKGFNQPIDL